MINDVLTDAFVNSLTPIGLKFPKVIKHKAVRNYRDYSWAKKKAKITKRSRPTLKVKIPRAPTYPQLVKQLDKAFSNFLKVKSMGKCSRCGQVRPNAGVSHYWSRVHKGTRWDEENCDWACWLPCHSIWEHEKQGAYMDFMIKKLGKKGYEKLRIKALAVAKWTTSDLQILIREYGHMIKSTP